MNQSKLEERLQRARSHNLLKLKKTESQTQDEEMGMNDEKELAKDMFSNQDIKEEIASKILNEPAESVDDIRINIEPSHAQRGRGPTNMFERKICYIGQKMGVKIVFE